VPKEDPKVPKEDPKMPKEDPKVPKEDPKGKEIPKGTSNDKKPEVSAEHPLII